MGTPITNEVLTKEKGFSEIGIASVQLRGKNGVNITYVRSEFVRISFLSNSIAVPGCKTMEDIDQLIKLFIE